MFRKAQAAMEFLMTYGWALLAVLVVIGALAYLGILDVETILPERCTFPVPLNCQDHVIQNEALQLVLLNGAGRGMNVRSIVAESEAFDADGAGDDNYKCVWTPLDSTGNIDAADFHLLRNGESQTFTLNIQVPFDTKFELVTLPGPPVTISGQYTAPAFITAQTFSASLEPDLFPNLASNAVTTGVLTFGAAAPAANCGYNDVGRGKNRYAITVYYTWSDSRSILHKVGGELFSASPE